MDKSTLTDIGIGIVLFLGWCMFAYVVANIVMAA